MFNDIKQLKLIYNAVRYYQINKVPLDSPSYRECDEVLNSIFPKIVTNYVEPAYEVDS